MGKAEGGAGLGKVISRHMKVKIPIRHPVEKPVGLRHIGPREGRCRLECMWETLGDRWNFEKIMRAPILYGCCGD